MFLEMKRVFSLPNLITYARILFIPVFVLVVFSNFKYKDILAALIFIILSLSDALDGYVARKKKQVTGIGKIIDPIADKLLIAAALFSFMDRIAIWMIIVIVAREIIITFARILFLPKKVISASILGKAKTISQIIAIIAVILNVPFNWWLMLAAVIITVVSGIDYLIKMIALTKERILTIPNIITTVRFILIPPLIVLILNQKINIALILFVIIIVSDKLDGISARITEQITAFGRIYDSFVDFSVLFASTVALYIAGYFSTQWIITLLVILCIMGTVKTLYYYKKKELSSKAFGKIVVAVAYISVAAFLIEFEYRFLVLIAISILSIIHIITELVSLIQLYKSK